MQGVPGPVLVAAPEAAAPGSEWLGEAVADMLPRALVELGVPAVDRADRLRAQEALEIPAVALTRATSIRIAEALGASRLVVGRYEVEGSMLSLSLRLLDVERGTLSAPLTASGPVEGVADLVRSLAWDIALSGPTRPAQARETFLARRPGVPLEALRAYAEGLSSPDAVTRAGLFKRALTLAPDYDDARLGLGRLQLDTREHPAALETLGRIKADSPLGRQARFLTGVALLELGRYQQAGAVYASLAASDPTAAVLNNHALALLRLGGSGGIRASQELRKAVETEPAVNDLAFNLGWALLAEGEPEAAAFWLRGVTRQDPRDTRARVALVWALRKAGRAEEADEEWRGLMAVASSYEPLAAPDLGRRFERVLHSERSLILDQEGRSDAELAASHVARAERLAEAGDAEAVFHELTQAAYLDPHAPRVHLLLSRAHRARGQTDKALNELRMSLWCRDDTAVRLELAALLKEAGREGEARAEAGKVLKLEPDNASARKLLEAPK